MDFEAYFNGKGYIENNKYYFYMKDYQGNNRVVADQSSVVAQRMSYYPFGMSGSTYGQPYKFGGKELDAMHGLNLYDFHARQQMPDLDVFTTMDPLAEENYLVSPYVYVDDNPIRWIDLDGMKKGDPDDPYELPEIVVVPSLPQKGDQVMDPTSNPLDYIFYRTYDYNANIIGKNYTISYLVNPNGIIINGGHILLTGTPPSVSTSNPLGTIKNIATLLKAAKGISKGGFTAVGRALMKHSHRGGTAFPKIQGNTEAINAQGEAVLKNILTDPNVRAVENSSPRIISRFGEAIIDYQIPSGMGARFNSDGTKFIGFLEP